MRPCILGTRGSALSLRQAKIVQTKLEERGCMLTLKMIKAQADERPEISLTAMSGEGVFVKELEQALLERRIDLAVHSMKDLPLDHPPTLAIAAVLEREEPRDAFVSRTGETFDHIARDSRIGTSSLRRQSQLLHRRQDVQFLEIRGNVDTRLRKLEAGKYDAIVLAACGLIRLGLEDRITEYLEFSLMLPEPGQGALAIEVRADDEEVCELIGTLDDPPSRSCVEAERAFLRALGGGCRVPIAAYASPHDGNLELEGAVMAADGHRQLRGAMTGPMSDATALGNRLAQHLMTQGALSLLKPESSRS